MTEQRVKEVFSDKEFAGNLMKMEFHILQKLEIIIHIIVWIIGMMFLK